MPIGDLFFIFTNSMKKFIYLIQSLESSKYKIGISKNPQKRLIQIQTGNGEELKIVAQYETENYSLIEGFLHRKYMHLKTKGEWFYLGLEEEMSFLSECEKAEENILILRLKGNEFI